MGSANDNELPYRGLFYCAVTGKLAIHFCIRDRHNKDRHRLYVRCNGRDGKYKYASVSTIDKCAENFLSSISVSEEVLNEIDAAAKKQAQAENAGAKEARRVLSVRLADAKRKKASLVDLMINNPGMLLREEFKERNNALAADVARIEDELKQAETAQSSFSDRFVSAAKLLAKAPSIFKVSTYPIKTDILKITCLKPFLDEGKPMFTAVSPFNFFVENRTVLGGAGGGT